MTIPSTALLNFRKDGKTAGEIGIIAISPIEDDRLGEGVEVVVSNGHIDPYLLRIYPWSSFTYPPLGNPPFDSVHVAAIVINTGGRMKTTMYFDALEDWPDFLPRTCGFAHLLE